MCFYLDIAVSNSPWFSVASSLPRLRFSSHRCEFAATTFSKDEVLWLGNGPIVSSGTVGWVLQVVFGGKNTKFMALRFATSG